MSAGALRFGCTLEQDDDGDWIIVPPRGVTIFSVPGEGVLIGRCDEETAIADAKAYLAGLTPTIGRRVSARATFGQAVLVQETPHTFDFEIGDRRPNGLKRIWHLSFDRETGEWDAALLRSRTPLGPCDIRVPLSRAWIPVLTKTIPAGLASV